MKGLNILVMDLSSKELRKRRREGILRVHHLEQKYEKYAGRFWYYFSNNSLYKVRRDNLPAEDQAILMFFKQFSSQQERAILWRNQEFVKGFCKRYFMIWS